MGSGLILFAVVEHEMSGLCICSRRELEIFRLAQSPCPDIYFSLGTKTFQSHPIQG